MTMGATYLCLAKTCAARTIRNRRGDVLHYAFSGDDQGCPKQTDLKPRNALANPATGSSRAFDPTVTMVGPLPSRTLELAMQVVPGLAKVVYVHGAMRGRFVRWRDAMA
jgi:hypothetical protein